MNTSIDNEFYTLRSNLGRLHSAEIAERITDPYGYGEMMLEINGCNIAIDKETAVCVAALSILDTLLCGAESATLKLRPDLLSCLIEHADMVGLIPKETT